MKSAISKKSLSVLVASAGIVLASTGIAQAQGDFPASRNMHNRGGFGQFDVRSGETQTIVDVDESTVYRICIVGNTSKVIVDGSKEADLDHGDCWDVEGKKIVVRGGDTAGDSQGYYEIMNPMRRRHMQ